ncbi:MAG: glycosyl hydrolase family 18 protein [Bacteroidota bacterium]
MTRLLLLSLLFCFACASPKQAETETPDTSPSERDIDVIAYYHGETSRLENYPLEELDMIIHSFLHLKGNKLALDDDQDSVSITHMVSLKEQYPDLKVLTSLGGWGGCKPCSEVFATAEGRQEFAESTKELLDKFGLDGLDLDWEYPGIAGYPEHPYMPEDKENFSLLIEKLREVLGPDYQLSFAAGGFQSFFEKSADWARIMPLLDRVNLMSYDLVSGYATRTGHHTPLYSTSEQIRSTDRGVRWLDSAGVDRKKIVIGAAIYARFWEEVPNENRGLYQPGKFLKAVSYRDHEAFWADNPGFEFYWDSTAQATWGYNAEKGWFATFDDPRSVAAKTQYARDMKLGGIMFWQLPEDKETGGLLGDIAQVANAQ